MDSTRSGRNILTGECLSGSKIKENKELEKKAWAGEDEAFFELLRRNPEYLETDLAMSRIMEWRFTIPLYRFFNRAKPILLTSRQEIDEVQREINGHFFPPFGG